MSDETAIATNYRDLVVATLDRMFWTALEVSGFETICTVLRVGGMADANWDPFEGIRQSFRRLQLAAIQISS